MSEEPKAEEPAAAGGAAPPAEAPAKPVAKKPVPAKPTPAAGAAPAGAAAAKKPAAKPAGKGKKGDDRRFFLFTVMGAAWTAFTVTMTAWGILTLRFMLPNVLAEPPNQLRVGAPDQFEPGGVDERWKNSFQVWIVNLNDEKKLIALSTICTHLGCTPSWLQGEQKFKCPCHGSGFYKTGINFEGPAPRPLERFAISEVDGVVLIDKSKKFQYELGQWTDPESFLIT